METKTVLIINLSILFLLLNLFQIVRSDPVEECATKIGNECGDTVLIYAVMHKTSVSKECCTKLIQSGRACHNMLIDAVVEAGKQFTQRKPQIMERQNEVWMKCEKQGQIA